MLAAILRQFAGSFIRSRINNSGRLIVRIVLPLLIRRKRGALVGLTRSDGAVQNNSGCHSREDNSLHETEVRDFLAAVSSQLLLRFAYMNLCLESLLLAASTLVAAAAFAGNPFLD